MVLGTILLYRSCLCTLTQQEFLILHLDCRNDLHFVFPPDNHIQRSIILIDKIASAHHVIASRNHAGDIIRHLQGSRNRLDITIMSLRPTILFVFRSSSSVIKA